MVRVGAADSGMYRYTKSGNYPVATVPRLAFLSGVSQIISVNAAVIDSQTRIQTDSEPNCSDTYGMGGPAWSGYSQFPLPPGGRIAV